MCDLQQTEQAQNHFQYRIRIVLFPSLCMGSSSVQWNTHSVDMQWELCAKKLLFAFVFNLMFEWFICIPLLLCSGQQWIGFSTHLL